MGPTLNWQLENDMNDMKGLELDSFAVAAPEEEEGNKKPSGLPQGLSQENFYWYHAVGGNLDNSLTLKNHSVTPPPPPA